MAVGGTKLKEYDEHILQENLQEQNDELLALQSIYEGSGVERLQVVSPPTGEKDGGLYTLLVTVPIQLSGQEVAVNVQGSSDDLKDGTTERATSEHSGNNIQSDQGDDDKHGTFKVKHLPSLSLQVVLPPTYPSQHAPEFTMSCVWLTANQLSALCRQLDGLWEESQNLPVLFTWIDWLDNNIFSYLKIDTSVDVCVDDTTGTDSRVQGNMDIKQAINTLIQYNCEEESAEFYKSSHECPVCCEEFPGREFYRLDSCGHHFCPDCMTSYCQYHVSVGTVEKLRCPDTECDSVLPPHIVQTVLPADQYDRWERLLLQKTLESMSDMDWCPRCNNPVILEEEEDLNLGHCTTCLFSFCTLCRDPWHQGVSCTSVVEKLVAAASEARFEEKRRKLEEELRSRISLQKKTKLCPNCKVKIEKTGGCNMMKCRCGTKFCWLCGLVLTNYSHFSSMNSRCNLMDLRELTPLLGTITPENFDDIQTLLYGQTQDTLGHPVARGTIERANCPTCRYRNVKAGRNNHIKCPCCSTNYCFLCRAKIAGVVTTHFNPGTCPQHS